MKMYFDQRIETIGVQNLVTELRTVTSNVAESPNCLLANIVAGGSKKRYENGQCLIVDDMTSLLTRSRSNVGEYLLTRNKNISELPII